MQPEMISLMQQLVTAVQSIALSVDVMSVDLRSLNKNVAHLVNKDSNKEISTLTLAPECRYTHDDETSTVEHVSGMEGAPSYNSDDLSGPKTEEHEKSETTRGNLREDIKKAMGRSSSLESSTASAWRAEFGDATSGRRAAAGGRWEGTQVAGGGTAEGAVSAEIGAGLSTGQGGEKGALRSFRCEWCGKEFPERYKLRNHIRIHTGERPFACPHCGKRFAHKENLIVHGRVHTGEKPFSCRVCGRPFAQMGQLTVHMRTHTGERPYRCTLCPKAFKDSGKLKRHMIVHG